MSKHTLYFHSFSPENVPFIRIMWKNIVNPDRPQKTVYCGAGKIRIACRITKKKTQTHTGRDV